MTSARISTTQPSITSDPQTALWPGALSRTAQDGYELEVMPQCCGNGLKRRPTQFALNRSCIASGSRQRAASCGPDLVREGVGIRPVTSQPVGSTSGSRRAPGRRRPLGVSAMRVSGLFAQVLHDLHVCNLLRPLGWLVPFPSVVPNNTLRAPHSPRPSVENYGRVTGWLIRKKIIGVA